MVDEGHAEVVRLGAQPVETVAQPVPLRVVHDVFRAEHGKGLTLHGIALFGRADDARARRAQEPALLHEVLFHFFIRFGEQEGAEPTVREPEPAQFERLFKCARIGGIFVAEFRAPEPRERHFADALLESVAPAEIGHIVVGPGDGSYAEFDFFLVHMSPFAALNTCARRAISRVFLRVRSSACPCGGAR